MIREFSSAELMLLLMAARWTIALSILAFIGGGILSGIICLMGTAKTAPLRWFAMFYIRVFQGTPLLLQLFLVYFGAELMGFPLGPWVSATLALSLNTGAFLGDTWRACILAVPKGQTEGAMSLGLHYWPTMWNVILPQALRIAIPPSVGFLVVLIKSTSLTAIIGFVELTRQAQLVNNATFRPFLVFGIVLIMYFLMCWPLTVASRWLEDRLAKSQQR